MTSTPVLRILALLQVMMDQMVAMEDVVLEEDMYARVVVAGERVAVVLSGSVAEEHLEVQVEVHVGGVDVEPTVEEALFQL